MLLRIDPVNPENSKIKIAAKAILAGKLVAIPTETVYGLAANAFDAVACKNIFKAKKRPSDNPLIVTVGSFEMADAVAFIPQEYKETIKKVWPSPLTFVVEAKAHFPKEVTSGLSTIALRMPAHPVPLALIKECGVPLAAPSANISKRPSATNAEHVLKDFGDSIDIIIDSGDSFFGVESTIIDLRNFKLLRPGAFATDEIEKFFGKKPHITSPSRGLEESDVAITPGMKYKHYAPSTPLALSDIDFTIAVNDLDAGYSEYLIKNGAFLGSKQTCENLSSHFKHTIAMGDADNLYEIARNLFSSLRKLDELNVKFGIVESFREEGIGLAIMNRLRKSTSHIHFGDHAGLKSFLGALTK